MSAPLVLEISGLKIGFYANGKEKVIVDRLSLDLDGGRFVCLIGPNGIGKTTLLRTLCGLHPPLAGEIRIGGEDLNLLSHGERAKKMAVVLTEKVSVGNMSVFSLVSMGRQPYTNFMGRLTDVDIEKAHWALEMVGASLLKERVFNELSDGESQKVLIARALAQDPDLLILDEPTNFLDVSNRVEVMMLLKKLSRETKKTILLSTHDLDIATKTADRIWLMTDEKKVLRGIPEDLMLNGDFNRLFGNQSFEFDIHTGSIKMIKKIIGKVTLKGVGEKAYWTKRALERIGYEVFPESENLPLYIEVVEKDKQFFWDVVHDNQKRVCNSIEDMLDLL